MRKIICISVIIICILLTVGCADTSSYIDYEDSIEEIDAQLIKDFQQGYEKSDTEVEEGQKKESLEKKYNDPHKNHSVKISVEHENGMIGESSGFLISPTTLVTTFHSIRGFVDIIVETPTQTAGIIGVYGYDVFRDIIILELNKRLDHPVIDCFNDAYGLDEEQTVVIQGYVDGQYPIISGSVINARRNTSFGDYFIDLHLPEGKPGFSGGVVITSNGEFCGMLLSGNEEDDSATIMSYEFINEFIKDYEYAELIPIELFNETYYLSNMNERDAVEPKTPEEKLCVDYLKYFFDSVNARTNNPTSLNISDEVRKEIDDALTDMNKEGWNFKYSIESITTWTDDSKNYINVIFDNEVKVEAQNGVQALDLMLFVVPKDNQMIEKVATTRYGLPGYAHEKHGFSNEFSELITWKLGKQPTLSNKNIDTIMQKVHDELMMEIDKKFLHMGKGKEPPENPVADKYMTKEEFTEDDMKQLAIAYEANYGDYALIRVYNMYETYKRDYFFVNIQTLECSKGHGIFN